VLTFFPIEQLGCNDAIDGTNIDTLVGVEVAFAINAFFGFDLEDHIAFENSFHGAFRLASAAGNAFISNCHCHDKTSRVSILKLTTPG